jgi:hypothetical protein
MSIHIPEYATLKLARAKAATVNGVATIDVKVPGTPGQDERLVNGGQAWFEQHHADDFVTVEIVDVDGLVAPAGTVVGSYTESSPELSSANYGWFIPLFSKEMHVVALAGYGHVPAGMYLRIMATTGDTRADTFRLNLIWGTKD